MEKVLDIVGVVTEIVIQNVSIAVLGLPEELVLLSMPCVDVDVAVKMPFYTSQMPR